MTDYMAANHAATEVSRHFSVSIETIAASIIIIFLIIFLIIRIRYS
ncbi:MAG: hypothetical protein ABIB71_04525 [Candidatus Woesearchaeota archaeon]